MTRADRALRAVLGTAVLVLALTVGLVLWYALRYGAP